MVPDTVIAKNSATRKVRVTLLRFHDLHMAPSWT
jgi:hypothetical protein